MPRAEEVAIHAALRGNTYVVEVAIEVHLLQQVRTCLPFFPAGNGRTTGHTLPGLQSQAQPGHARKAPPRSTINVSVQKDLQSQGKVREGAVRGRVGVERGGANLE